MPNEIKTPARLLIVGLEKKLFVKQSPARDRIVSQLKECGLEHVTIMVLAHDEFDEFIESGIRVVSTNSVSRWLYFWDAFFLIYKLRKENFNVVLSQDPVETGLIAYAASKLYGCALAIQDHGYYFHGDYFKKESLVNRLRFFMAKFLIKQANAIRVVSLRTERAVCSLGIKVQKVVRFPVNLSGLYKYQREPAELDIDKPYFLLVARFVSIKRIDIALHAFSKVVKDYPLVKLHIFGKGPLREYIQDKIKEFELVDSVVLSDWTDDLASEYSHCLATLITSDGEGFGMTAIESLIHSRPVIMTDVGCAGEVVKDGENGFVVPVGDVVAIADRMQQLINEPSMFNMGIKNFVWNQSSDNMRDLLQLALVNNKM